MNRLLKGLFKVLDICIKIIVIGVFVFPFLWMISMALQTNQEVNTFPTTFIPKIPQFKNLLEAWNKVPFAVYLRNSLTIIVSVISFQVLIMIPAAYAFAKYEFKGRGLFFSLVIIAFMTPGQVTFIPIYQMMARSGLLRTLLPQIIPSLTNAFGIFLLRQYFMQVPNELIESAKLDKAGELSIIFRIMLPMSKAALSTITLFSFIGHWNEYFWPLVITNSDTVRPLSIGVMRLREVDGLTNWHIIMAGNMLLTLPVLVIYAFACRNIIKAFAYSGIK
jgi:sn-glycerol 3-phosphate transport system permease protein